MADCYTARKTSRSKRYPFSLRFSLQFSNREEKQTKTQKTLDGGIIETRSLFLIVDGTKCPGDD